MFLILFKTIEDAYVEYCLYDHCPHSDVNTLINIIYCS